MKKRGWFLKCQCLGFIFMLLAMSSGCASYNARAVITDTRGPDTAASTGGLTLSVEEYATEAKCKQAFDSDLAGKGVLALFVKVENNGQDTWEIAVRDFTGRCGAPLRMLTPSEAAAKTKRSAVARAIGWSLIVPIISIPVAATASVIHTNKVNAQIKQDFNDKAFKDGPILANKERSGFLFYELSKGQNNLQGMDLALSARNAGTLETISIVTPLPEATFKPVKAEDATAATGR